MNPIVAVMLSFVPLILIGGWLVYREIKSKRAFPKQTGHAAKKIRVGDKNYIVKKKTRILAVEKNTGQDVIVTTCGFEDEDEQLEGEIQNLPEGIKVHYRLGNGIFSPEESDWVAGEDFKYIGVRQVEEYEPE